jgi:DNA-binding response OmpR family regulator
MAHILVIEDEQPISDLIPMNLKLVGHTWADLFLLDVMLPGSGRV